MVIGHDPQYLQEKSFREESRQISLNPAPRLDRFAAGIVDSAIVFMFAKVFAAHAIFSLRISESFSLYQAFFASLFNLFWLTFAVLLMYKVITYRLLKRSLGELLFSTQIASSLNGKPIDQYNFVLRTFLSYVGFFLIYPIFSIFINRDGRTFYDKICDSIVLTTKENTRRLNFYLPYDRLFGSLIIVSMFAVFSYTSLYFTKNVFKFNSDFVKNENVCSYISDYHQDWNKNKIAESRLEVALALYSADELNSKCLSKEVDFELLVNPRSSTAYLAKGLLSVEDKSKFLKYFVKTCELDSRSAACHVASWMTFWPNKFEGELSLDFNVLPTFAKIWLIKRDYQKGNILELANKLEDMKVPKGLESFYAENLMRVDYFYGSREKIGSLLKVVENKNLYPRKLTESFCEMAVAEDCNAFKSFKSCGNLKLNRSAEQHLSNMFYACSGKADNIFSTDSNFQKYYTSLAKKEPQNLENLKTIFMNVNNPFGVRFATLNSFFKSISNDEYLKKVLSDWEESPSKDFIWRLAGESLKTSFNELGDLQSSFQVYKKLSSEYSEIKPNNDILKYAKEVSRYPAQEKGKSNNNFKGR